MIHDDNLSLKQKKQYIKRYIDNDILCIESSKDIYRIIRNNNPIDAIRNTKSINDCGIFVDLNKVTDESIEQIYYIVKRRLESISMK